MSLGYRKRIELAQLRMSELPKRTHIWSPPERKQGANPNLLAAKINGKSGAAASPFTYNKLRGK
jgi:hypothetical protein